MAGGSAHPISLVDAREGETLEVVEILGGHGLVARLEALGIRPGAEMKKITSVFLRGPVTVEVRDTRVAIGYGMARKVLVRSTGDRETLGAHVAMLGAHGATFGAHGATGGAHGATHGAREAASGARGGAAAAQDRACQARAHKARTGQAHAGEACSGEAHHRMADDERADDERADDAARADSGALENRVAEHAPPSHANRCGRSACCHPHDMTDPRGTGGGGA